MLRAFRRRANGLTHECAACGPNAFVWTDHNKYVLNVAPSTSDLDAGAMKWTLFAHAAKAVEACISLRGIVLVDETRTVAMHHFGKGLTAELVPLPEQRVRPSLGGNMLSLLFWRRELHHLCGRSTARLVFYLLCCWRLHVQPFGLLPRDVLYYVLSYVPMF